MRKNRRTLLLKWLPRWEATRFWKTSRIGLRNPVFMRDNELFKSIVKYHHLSPRFDLYVLILILEIFILQFTINLKGAVSHFVWQHPFSEEPE